MLANLAGVGPTTSGNILELDDDENYNIHESIDERIGCDSPSVIGRSFKNNENADNYIDNNSQQSPQISESLALKIEKQNDLNAMSKQNLHFPDLDQSNGVTLDDIRKSGNQLKLMLLQSQGAETSNTDEYKSKVGGTDIDRTPTPLLDQSTKDAVIVKRKVGGTVIPRSKIQPAGGNQGTAQKVTSASIKRQSMNQTQPLPQVIVQLFSIEKLSQSLSNESDNLIKLGDQTVKIVSKDESDPKNKVMELGKGFYQMYPPLVDHQSVINSITFTSQNPTMRLNMIKVQMKLQQHCQIDLDLQGNSQPLTSGDVSPPMKIQRIKLTLSTQQGQQQPSTSIASRDGVRTQNLRVNLDGDKHAGKWQTLCIDLDKIVGPKIPRGSRLSLQKMHISAPGSQFIDVNAIYQGFSTSGAQQASKVSIIKLTNQAQNMANNHQRNNQQQIRSVIRPRRAVESSTQATPIQNEESKILKSSPQTTSNYMGHTITGNSFTTTATSLNNTGTMIVGVDSSGNLVFQGKRRSNAQQSLNSRQQERSRDITSANSQSLLKTPQSIASSKTVNGGIEHLPPLFSSNKHQPRILTTQGELNIIHENQPFHKKPQHPNRRQLNGQQVAKSTSVAPPSKHSSHQVSRSNVAVGKSQPRISQIEQIDEIQQSSHQKSNHRYLEKMNERQKRMEQKYFKKDLGATPSQDQGHLPGSVHHSKSVSSNILQNNAQSTSKKGNNGSLGHQRPSRMKIMAISQSNQGINGGGGYTPFSHGNYGSTGQQQRNDLMMGSTNNNQGPRIGGTGNNFYDFKKSCATFSSTLRNFQNDDTSNHNGQGFRDREGQGDDEVEESIQEEIDQSGRGHHNNNNDKKDKRPPLQPHRTLSFQKKVTSVTVNNYPNGTTPSIAGSLYNEGNIQAPTSQVSTANEKGGASSNNQQYPLIQLSHPEDLYNNQQEADEYDEHYSGLYLVGPTVVPQMLENNSNMDVISNKTAATGFYQPSQKREYSPGFKLM